MITQTFSVNERRRVFDSVRLKMKSLSILLASFATSLAIHISEYNPKDPTVSITKGETLELSCKTNTEWEECEFKHESNEKKCNLFWSSYPNLCNGETIKLHQDANLCIIEIKEVKVEDAGSWTCKISDANKNSKSHKFVVEVKPHQDVSDKTLTTTIKPPVNSTATALTKSVAFSILAITFLIKL